MSKIFDVQDWLKNHPNRNNFDLTHKVHGSYQFGKLYPVLCKPVVPTDSFRIDTAVSLRFTPMPFPTQSNMRVIFHYFYVRNKNIWKNWANWLQGLEEHTPPYVSPADSTFFGRGSLSDHLGISSGYHISSETTSIKVSFVYERNIFNSSVSTTSNVPILPANNIPSVGMSSESLVTTNLVTSNDVFNNYFAFADICSEDSSGTAYSFGKGFYFKRFLPLSEILVSYNDSRWLRSISSVYYIIYWLEPVGGVYTIGAVSAYDSMTGDYLYSFYGSNFDQKFSASSILIKYDVLTGFDEPFLSTVSPLFYTNGYIPAELFMPSRSVDLSSDSLICPYFHRSNTGSDKIKVSALPFRAYESIYNAFYRNSQGVQPFQINGVTQYNKYVTNDADGADSTNYDFFERNWELDAYTSCLISPQQGNVPYVGITDISALGNMRVETPDGNSAEVRLSDNGDGVEISNLRGDTPEARAYALRAASSGFTIPEFREANALQRFLEMNIRKGYKYIDFIEGHFGRKPTYAEMDMPEFIGGFSQRISVNEISNTNGVDNDTLGAIAGQARAIGGSKHGINHYFDDFGFVVGIMCIVPDNAYDSILPKHFNLKNPLDCYFPEFSQLSYMPLTHEEFCPVQTINDPRGSSYRDLTKVFGYQRPNHDLVWYPDTVHGLFRDASGIGNSIICRRFGVRPDLSDAFLRIKPDETDTIFNYTFGDNDVVLGEIVLSIKAKRPIPRLVVPTIS